jgi:hypothetical protein
MTCSSFSLANKTVALETECQTDIIIISLLLLPVTHYTIIVAKKLYLHINKTDNDIC